MKHYKGLLICFFLIKQQLSYKTKLYTAGNRANLKESLLKNAKNMFQGCFRAFFILSINYTILITVFAEYPKVNALNVQFIIL